MKADLLQYYIVRGNTEEKGMMAPTGPEQSETERRKAKPKKIFRRPTHLRPSRVAEDTRKLCRLTMKAQTNSISLLRVVSLSPLSKTRVISPVY